MSSRRTLAGWHQKQLDVGNDHQLKLKNSIFEAHNTDLLIQKLVNVIRFWLCYYSCFCVTIVLLIYKICKKTGEEEKRSSWLPSTSMWTNYVTYQSQPLLRLEKINSLTLLLCMDSDCGALESKLLQSGQAYPIQNFASSWCVLTYLY